MKKHYFVFIVALSVVAVTLRLSQPEVSKSRPAAPTEAKSSEAGTLMFSSPLHKLDSRTLAYASLAPLQMINEGNKLRRSVEKHYYQERPTVRVELPEKTTPLRLVNRASSVLENDIKRRTTLGVGPFQKKRSRRMMRKPRRGM